MGELLANGQRAVVPDVPTIASGSENMTVPTWDAKRNNGAISIEWKGPHTHDHRCILSCIIMYKSSYVIIYKCMFI